MYYGRIKANKILLKTTFQNIQIIFQIFFPTIRIRAFPLNVSFIVFSTNEVVIAQDLSVKLLQGG